MLQSKSIQLIKLCIIILALLLEASGSAPQGIVTVYDNRLKTNVPIYGLEVELKSPRGIRKTYTNARGEFAFPSNSQHGNYQINWRTQNNQFFIKENGDNLATIKGPSTQTPWNLSINGKGKNHFHAMIFRGSMSYISSDFVDPQKPMRNIEINAYYRKKRGSGEGKARFNALNKELYFWAINSRNGKPYSDIRLFSFATHEFAHVHHDYFFKGRSQYLDTEPRLRESWAEATKYFLVKAEYGQKGNPELADYSKQTSTFHSGWRNHHWGKRAKYFSVYTPAIIDLVDDHNQDGVDDRVSGYTLAQIFNVLKHEDCEDFDDLSQLLKKRYDNPTEQYLDILFREMEEKK